MFRVEKINKSFGGLKAVNNVSFKIAAGELSSIIGPNGAGKTTLFNLLTGHLHPDTGGIFFKEEQITKLSPHQICRRGIARSFQRTNIFPRCTVFENVHVAVMAWKRKSGNIFLQAKKILQKETDQILESVGLEKKKNMTAGLLAHGDQRRLEIGIVLGCFPKFLLLDEPTAGMGSQESEKTVDLIEDLARQKGLTVLFIEHDMKMVFRISEKIRVMHEGKIIAAGTPEEVRSNIKVQRIYLAED